MFLAKIDHEAQAHSIPSKGWHSISSILSTGSWKKNSSLLLHGFIFLVISYSNIFLYSLVNHLSFTLLMFLFCFRRSISACIFFSCSTSTYFRPPLRVLYGYIMM